MNRWKYVTGTVATAITVVVIAVSISTVKPGLSDGVVKNEIAKELTIVEEVYREFITLDSKLVDEEGLKDIEKLKKVVEEEAYNNAYEQTIEFIGLPEKSEAPRIRFVDTVVQENSEGYKVIGIVNQEYSTGQSYTLTTRVQLNKGKMVVDYTTIPHVELYN